MHENNHTWTTAILRHAKLYILHLQTFLVKIIYLDSIGADQQSYDQSSWCRTQSKCKVCFEHPPRLTTGSLLLNWRVIILGQGFQRNCLGRGFEHGLGGRHFHQLVELKILLAAGKRSIPVGELKSSRLQIIWWCFAKIIRWNYVSGLWPCVKQPCLRILSKQCQVSTYIFSL